MAVLTDALNQLAPVSNPWLVVVIAGTPSVLSGGWVAWKWWTERHDKTQEAELTADEREAVRLERERQSLSAGQQQLFATVSAENERLRGELSGTRQDRDRGWSFARRCERRMHELYHQLINTRQMVDNEREVAKKTAVVWSTDAPLPTDQEISA